MAEVDHYQVLGVSPDAPRDEIRRAYRRLARRVHPDTNPEWEDDAEANQRMVVLNEAYAVLGDPARRAVYDFQRRRGLDERDQSRTGRATAETYAQPSEGRPEFTFRPSMDRQLALIMYAVLLITLGSVGIYWGIARSSWFGVLVASAGLLGGALSAMAAIPYFQGYIVLTQDALIEYPVFGLFRERVYRYDQICDVHWLERRHRYGRSIRIKFDYFRTDPAGRLDVRYYDSKWLMSVGDPHTLFYALRKRATALKSPFARPTLNAFVRGWWDLFAPVVWMIALLLLGMIGMLFSFSAK